MRTLFIALFFSLFSMTAVAQTVPPAWPEISFTSCPKIGPTLDPNQRTWKYGKSEQGELAAISQMLNAKNDSGAIDRAAKFVEQYPDSDYRDVVLGLELTAQTHLTEESGENRLAHESGETKIAEQIIRSPSADARIRMMGFVTLVMNNAHHIVRDDPEKKQKLADVEQWTQCGREALAGGVPPGMPQDALEKGRQHMESYLNRADGFIAMMREQYDLAEMKLQMAYRENSQDTLTCYLLFETRALSLNPDVNTGIFYLARWATLEPEVNASTKMNFLKQIYVILHGSEKGLSDVLAVAKLNTIPPAGFNILPQPKEKHHYGTAIAAAAIIGLFAFEMAKHPDVARGIASSFIPPTAAKMMVFGGPDHQVYLGCLSCSDVAPDSIFNSVGPHGSRIATESIWNGIQQFGSRISPYSACNPLAKDPPIIVDQEGTAYGRLTVNRFSREIGMGARFYDWLSTVVCQR
jgi:hypothetical protein